MKIINLLFAAALILLSLPSDAQNTMSLAENQASPDASIEDVAWIAGHWRGEAFGGIAEEIWSPPMGGSLMGVFRLVKEDKVDFYEIEAISEIEETLVLRLKHFHADLRGWEEKDETVDFPLVKLEDQKAYFDGMTFDRTSDTEMDVYVVIGSDDGSAQEMKFSYRLVDK